MISPDLQTFINGSIRSVWALELLLLLKRDAECTWTPEKLVVELRASTPLVADVLRTFDASGLIRREDGEAWRYAPAASALAALADELEQVYRTRPGAVVKAIISAPNDKLQSFADAFRFRGDPK